MLNDTAFEIEEIPVDKSNEFFDKQMIYLMEDKLISEKKILNTFREKRIELH